MESGAGDCVCDAAARRRWRRFEAALAAEGVPVYLRQAAGAGYLCGVRAVEADGGGVRAVFGYVRVGGDPLTTLTNLFAK